MLAVYRVFVGDFSVDDFSASFISILLYVMLTFSGIIILLNVIIAMVCDSYYQSNRESKRLYGRARLSYVAALLSMEILIHPLSNLHHRRIWNKISSGYKCSFLFVRSITILVVLLSLLNLAFMALTFVEFFGTTGYPPGLSLILTASIVTPFGIIFVTLCSFLITGWEIEADDNQSFKWLKKFQRNILFKYLVSYPTKFLTDTFMGTSTQNSHSMNKNLQLSHIKSESEGLVLERLENIESTMSEFEMRMIRFEKDLKAHAENSHKDMKAILKAVTSKPGLNPSPQKPKKAQKQNDEKDFKAAVTSKPGSNPSTQNLKAPQQQNDK